MIKFNIDKIRGVMAEHHIIQEMVANAWNVSRKTVVNKLSGKTKITVDELVLIANLTNSNISIFFENQLHVL